MYAAIRWRSNIQRRTSVVDVDGVFMSSRVSSGDVGRKFRDIDHALGGRASEINDRRKMVGDHDAEALNVLTQST